MSDEIPEEILPEVEQFKTELQAIVDENKRLKDDAPKTAAANVVSGWRAAIATFRTIIQGQ